MQTLDDLSHISELFRRSLRETFSETTYNLWFAEMRLEMMTDVVAVFFHPSQYKTNMIERKYTEVVKEHLEKVIGFPLEPVFFSDEGESPDLSVYDRSLARPKIPPITEEQRTEAQAILHTDADELVMPLSTVDYTFENFVEGNSNKFAYAAALAVANNPATAYNPLFLYGPAGIGKTHLMYAIVNKIKADRPGTKVVYVKGDEFTNQLIDAIARKDTAAFRDKYRKADVFLIDDIQFIAGRVSTQEEFFHTFNALYEDKKQVILSSDRPPRDIKTLEDRLKSRFEWGLIADIQPPDYDLRLAVLKNKAERGGVDLPNEVLTYLAENLMANIRQIEGAIKKLGAYSLLTGTRITVDLARESVADLISGNEPVGVTIDKILHAVSEKYGVDVEDIKGTKRQKSIMLARHISIFMIRRATDMSLPAIGKIFNRDHSTILSSINVIEKETKVNKVLEMEINDLLKEIKR